MEAMQKSLPETSFALLGIAIHSANMFLNYLFFISFTLKPVKNNTLT
jgi:hypothetical protein